MLLEVWRVVEAQFINSTRKLVDSDSEQAILEELIDSVKPPVPPEIAKLNLHYLLFTPFRHPPLRNGSRFGTRIQRGLFYGSVEIETALAEVAYYRLVFLEGTSADLGLVKTEHTAFSVGVQTQRGVDLIRPPFDAYRHLISSKTDYSAAQQLGTELRDAGVEVICFPSARHPEGGTNVGLLTPAFSAKQPHRSTPCWVCHATKDRVDLKEKNVFQQRQHTFPRETFLVEGVLPSPAI